MTLEELKQYDGKDGRPAYIAYQGKIYDLSASDFWTGGTHMGTVNAGKDVTSQIGLSPHGEANILKYPVVGDLTEASANSPKKEIDPKTAKALKYQELYAKFHPHPMMVHFPMGMFPLAFFLAMISLVVENGFYVTFASIATMTFATLFIIPAVLSGVVSLAINYNWKTNLFLRRKITLSVLLLAVGTYATIIGLKAAYFAVCPNAIGTGEPLSMGYYVAAILVMPIVMGIGYNGGKITWSGK